MHQKSANHVLSLTSSAWSWAKARDLTTVPNPCSLVEGRTESRCLRYAKDTDYDQWIAYSKEHEALHLCIVSEIAYLCQLEKVEV